MAAKPHEAVDCELKVLLIGNTCTYCIAVFIFCDPPCTREPGKPIFASTGMLRDSPIWRACISFVLGLLPFLEHTVCLQFQWTTRMHAGVGKSCLLLRFVEDLFSPSYLSTIGIDFKTKVVDFEGRRVRIRVSLHCLNH